MTEQQLINAKKAMEKGDYVACETLLRRYLMKRGASKRDDREMAAVYHDIGKCLYYINDDRQSSKYFARAAKIFRAYNPYQSAINLFWQASSSYYVRRDRSAALACEAAIQAFRSIEGDHANFLVDLLGRQADCFCTLGDFASAKNALKQAVKEASSESVSIKKCGRLAGSFEYFREKVKKLPGRKPNVTSLINKFKNLVNAKMPEAIQPQTSTTDHEDNYFGTVVRDPYRWLESDDSKVENWIDKQNAYSDQYLSRILGASWLANKVRDFFPQENIRFPRRFGNYFFTGAGAQLTRSKSVNAVGSKVIEQDELPQAAVQSTFISRDGELVVFVLSDDSNWCQLQIKDLKSGTWSKVRSIAMRHVYVDWCLDGSGFYYCGQPKDEVGSKIFLHKLSSKYRRDKLIYHDVDPARQIHIALLSYGSHLGILTSKYPNRYSLMIKDLSKNDAPVTAIAEQPHVFSIQTWDTENVYIRTDKFAERGRLISVNFKSEKPRVRQVIPEFEEKLGQVIKLSHDCLLAFYFGETRRIVRIFHADGQLKNQVGLPVGADIVNICLYSANKVRLLLSGYTLPPSIYELDIRSSRVKLIKRSKVRGSLSGYTTEKLYARSQDGTVVPFYMSYKKPLSRNGNNPVIATGYSAFSFYTRPHFNCEMVAWMDMGGVFVSTVLRGGSDYGKAWRQAGISKFKQNSFDDFAAVLRYLIDSKITRPERLGIRGSSAGGLLAAVTVTQNPELIAAAFVSAGFTDMLRYQKFGVAVHYATEYLTANNRSGFKTLIAYSPLHNLTERSYPAVLCITGTEDDRVAAMHSFKFVAALQAKQRGSNPILLRALKGAGHQFYDDLLSLKFFAHHLGVLVTSSSAV